MADEDTQAAQADIEAGRAQLGNSAAKPEADLEQPDEDALKTAQDEIQAGRVALHSGNGTPVTPEENGPTAQVTDAADPNSSDVRVEG